MKVFVVLEEHRGSRSGLVAGVFLSYVEAMDFINGPEGANCYLSNDKGEVVKGTDE